LNYSRQASKSSLSTNVYFVYHNHILIGCNLWFVQKRLKPKDVASSRLILIQGTRNGRLRGMTLNMDSERRGSIHTLSIEGVFHKGAKNMIEVIGINHIDAQDTAWQLVTLSEEVFYTWMEKLKKAKSLLNIVEASGGCDKLRTLAKRMRLVVR
jgi:hypothetical protein